MRDENRIGRLLLVRHGESEGNALRRFTESEQVPLTPRECEVLKLVATGDTNKQIAVTLKISYETVKEHVQHILRKIGVTDRTQAALWSVRQGMV